MLVWSTGLAPNPLLQSLDSDVVAKHDKTGSLLTDDNLHVVRKDKEGHITPNEDVWAIGDAAVIDGAVLPATAQGVLLGLLPSSIQAKNVHSCEPEGQVRRARA